MVIPAGLAVADYRERVLAAVRFLADQGLGRMGYPEPCGGAEDAAGSVVVFETLAFGDLSVLVKFGVPQPNEAVARAPTPGLSEVLRSLAALYSLSRIEADRGWFLESGYVEGGKARAIRAQVSGLCRNVRDYAELLVEGFGVPDSVLPDRARTRPA